MNELFSPEMVLDQIYVFVPGQELILPSKDTHNSPTCESLRMKQSETTYKQKNKNPSVHLKFQYLHAIE